MSDNYADRLEGSGITNGERVRVLPFDGLTRGWTSRWTPGMEAMVGKEYTVGVNHGACYILGYSFPYFCLEKVEAHQYKVGDKVVICDKTPCEDTASTISWVTSMDEGFGGVGIVTEVRLKGVLRVKILESGRSWSYLEGWVTPLDGSKQVSLEDHMERLKAVDNIISEIESEFHAMLEEE